MVLTPILMSMRVHVLLYESGKENEGIHSLEIKGTTVVLMFEDQDDAERYCGLLEAQDFPRPTVESLPREEIESFCKEAGYEPRIVETGFIPQSPEDRILLVPPDSNLDVSNWQDNQKASQTNLNPDNQSTNNQSTTTSEINKLEEIRKRLENLL